MLHTHGQASAPQAAEGAIPSVYILGIRVHCMATTDVLRLVADWIAEAQARRAHGEPVRTRQIVTLNPEIVMAAQRSPALRTVINGSDLVLADGIGIVLAARLRGVRGLVRLTGVDLVQLLAASAAASGWRLYLLGAEPGVADEAARRLQARHPALSIAGAYAGSPRVEADAHTSSAIRATAADLVCVAYGAPAQEEWIARNVGALGAAVAIGVGGTFDFLAGRVPRAPVALRRMGLEWAYRLWREPWRWRRMLALPRFTVAVAVEALRQGISRNGTLPAAELASGHERRVEGL